MSLELNGKLSTPVELKALYNSNSSLDLNGHLSSQEELALVYDDEPLEIKGHLSIPEYKYIGKPYKGPYEVLPNGDMHILPTLSCTLVDDIFVFPIPYSEVRNEYGGVTVTIGE